MPFPDEDHTAVVVSYSERWPLEYQKLAAALREVLGSMPLVMDHVGSTSVPGLAAKDCIDIQIQVSSFGLAPNITSQLTGAGYRLRSEAWNRVETSFGHESPKLVFAPAPGARPCNIHVRLLGSPNVRYALLFRDFLRANDVARDSWSEFKTSLARAVPDLSQYGTIKQPATRLLMMAAIRWSQEAAIIDLRDGSLLSLAI